jgi:3-hydroxyacyl-[acyl-carrier-protein] dehydratase
MRDSIVAAQIGGPAREGEGLSVFEFRFGADDPTFAGHFPGYPILPGVFQLEIARWASEQVLQCSLAIREIKKGKFQRPILPAEIVRLELKLKEVEGAVRAHAAFSVCGQKAGETNMTLWRSG